MKKEIRKPTYSEIYMYQSLFWFGVAVFVICPVINNILLQMLYIEFSVNAAYSSLALPLQLFKEAFSLAYIYGGYAVFAVCLLYFGKKAKGVAVLALLTHAVSVATYAITLYMWGALRASVIAEQLINELANLAFKIILYFVLIYFAEKKNTVMSIADYTFAASIKKHPYTFGFALIAGAVTLINIIIETVNNIVYYTNPKHYYQIPDTFGEVVQVIVMPYVYYLIYAAIGFAVAVLVGFMANRLKESGKRKIAKLRELKTV